MKSSIALLALFAGLVPMAALACPMFVEFLPDPVDVPDDSGEYVEIRLDDFLSDSLYVRLDEKKPLAYKFPRGANRMVLVHDSLQCPRRDSLACGILGYTLPNSRESLWQLVAGTCIDSTWLPEPKSGKALQRVAETQEWAFTGGTFGTADPEYELGVEDCGLQWNSVEQDGDYGWKFHGNLTGCDSSAADMEYLDFASAGGVRVLHQTLSEVFSISVESKGSLWMRITLPGDAAPANDTLDTLVIKPEKSPVLISEVHHCPEEPVPEWVEIYNGSRYALPLEKLRFCDRGGFFKAQGRDSLKSYESLLLTKDTLGLREHLGFGDVGIVYVAMGYLSNVSGSLKLCFDGTVLDSVSWTKNTVECPAGFSPLSQKAGNTPGFQRHDASSSAEQPFTYKLSSRVVSKRGAPLRVAVESESNVKVQLLDSAGHSVWNTQTSPGFSSWMDVPAREMCKVGVCYVSLSLEDFEKVVGIVVRP